MTSVTVQGVAKSFGGRQVLAGVDLEVPQGNLTASVRSKFDPALKVREQNEQMDQRVWDMIENDPHFYRYFLQTD